MMQNLYNVVMNKNKGTETLSKIANMLGIVAIINKNWKNRKVIIVMKAIHIHRMMIIVKSQLFQNLIMKKLIFNHLRF